MGRFSENPEKAAHESGPKRVEPAPGGPIGPIGPENIQGGAAEKNNLTGDLGASEGDDEWLG